MNHDEAQVLWLLAKEGALEDARRADLDSHLAGCSQCRAEVERLASADRALLAWGMTAVPPALAAAPAGPVIAPTAAPAAAPRWPLALAAGLAGVMLGLAGGYAAAPRGTPAAQPRTNLASSPLPVGPDGRTTFVLMLEEPAGTWPPAQPVMRPGYFEWRDTLAAHGQFDDGERLAEDDGWYVAPGGVAVPMKDRPPSAANYSGLFLVRAASYDEAVAIARSSPHAQYGGILVRRTY